MCSSSSRTASASANGASRTSASAGPRHRPSASFSVAAAAAGLSLQTFVSRASLERGELADVGVIGWARDSVAGRHALNQLPVAAPVASAVVALVTEVVEGLADLMYVDLERSERILRRLLAPQPVDKAVGGDHVRSGKGEHRDQRTLARRPEVNGLASLGHLERTQQPELHSARLERRSNLRITQECWIRPPKSGYMPGEVTLPLPELLLLGRRSGVDLRPICPWTITCSRPGSLDPGCGDSIDPGGIHCLERCAGDHLAAERVRHPRGTHARRLAGSRDHPRCRQPVGQRRQLVPGHSPRAPGQPLRVRPGRRPAGHPRRPRRPAGRAQRCRERRPAGQRRRQTLPVRRCADALDHRRQCGAGRGHPRRPCAGGGVRHAGSTQHWPSSQATLTTRECAYFPGPYPASEPPCIPGFPSWLVSDRSRSTTRGSSTSRGAGQPRRPVPAAGARPAERP